MFDKPHVIDPLTFRPIILDKDAVEMARPGKGITSTNANLLNLSGKVMDSSESEGAASRRSAEESHDARLV